jgi:RNA polymerase sigma-70 factor (ECF subfamily)
MSLPIIPGAVTGAGAWVGGIVVSGVGAFVVLRGARLTLPGRQGGDARAGGRPSHPCAGQESHARVADGLPATSPVAIARSLGVRAGTTAPTPRTGEATRASGRGTLQDLDDRYVAQRHVGGDPKAFGVLVDRYQTRLLNFINRTIGNRERAEAIVQEIFIRVFRHLHRFDHSKKFSTWIYTIASDVAKTQLRSSLPEPLVLHRAGEGEDATACSLADAVARCVRQLPHGLRDAFILRELEGLSYEEIAVITGSTVEAVRSRLSRARTRLAHAIDPLLNAPGHRGVGWADVEGRFGDFPTNKRTRRAELPTQPRAETRQQRGDRI